MSDAKLPILSRRHVFAGAGTAGALAVAAAAMPLAGEAEKLAAAPQATPDQGGGYQVTPHVLRYYQTTRV
jgi:hypothetical protein